MIPRIFDYNMLKMQQIQFEFSVAQLLKCMLFLCLLAILGILFTKLHV